VTFGLAASGPLRATRNNIPRIGGTVNNFFAEALVTVGR
jgi:hypothetical protein